LKGTFRNSARGNGLRKGLVVFQFGISIFLIAGTLIIVNHLVISVRSASVLTNRKYSSFPTGQRIAPPVDFKVLKNELMKVSGVTSTSLSSQVPGREWATT